MSTYLYHNTSSLFNGTCHHLER